MAYSLHIEREGNPITLEEWRATVERIDGLRMAVGDAEFTNPRTHELISLPNRGGDVEIRCSSDEWIRALYFSKSGSVTFRADLLSGPDERQLVEIVFAAARDLNARIAGDDGEEYGETDFGGETSEEPHANDVLQGPWTKQ